MRDIYHLYDRNLVIDGLMFLFECLGEVMGEVYNVPSPAWQEAVTGVHRRRLVLLASQALAGMYRRALMANIENI